MDYNQENSNIQNANTPENIDHRGSLPNASRICGIISMTLGILSITCCCLGFFSIPIGALSILFAILSRRLGKKFPPECITGIALSVTGMIITLIIIFFSLYNTITNPQFWEDAQESYEQYQKQYEEMYGDMYSNML